MGEEVLGFAELYDEIAKQFNKPYFSALVGRCYDEDYKTNSPDKKDPVVEKGKELQAVYLKRVHERVVEEALK